MKVWVVTTDEHSYEGLEDAFDVYVGVAVTPMDALALLGAPNPPDHDRADRDELTMDPDGTTCRVIRWRTSWRTGLNKRTMQTFRTDSYELQEDAWTIREVQLDDARLRIQEHLDELASIWPEMSWPSARRVTHGFGVCRYCASAFELGMTSTPPITPLSTPTVGSRGVDG